VLRHTDVFDPSLLLLIEIRPVYSLSSLINNLLQLYMHTARHLDMIESLLAWWHGMHSSTESEP
jgi:hypothetical protein